MAAKSILENNICRTIGTGAETKVWEDAWIPSEPPRPARPAHTEFDADIKVHHLIDFDSKEWNLDVISAMIHPDDIPQILAIKISKTGRRDGYSWKHTKSGHYSVKTGYDIAVDQRKQARFDPIVEPSVNPLKKKLWKLKTVRKIKHFLWQALSGYVSSASKLVERHCGTDKTCQRCGAEIEDINHILFLCPPAFQCWIMSPIPSPPGIFPCTSLYANFDYLLQKGLTTHPQREVFSMFPWLIWYVWKARNEKCFNAKDISPIDTLQLATQEAETWRVAQLVETGEAEEQHHEQRPIPELSDSEKRFICQIDGSWSDKDEWMGLGFVLFQENTAILQGQKCTPRGQAPIHAEAEGIIWAMREVKDKGFDGIEFISDCQQLINLIIRNEEWPALAPELDDIKLLSSYFQDISISFAPRSDTLRADSLAKGGRSRAMSFAVVDILVHPIPALEAGRIEPE